MESPARVHETLSLGVNAIRNAIGVMPDLPFEMVRVYGKDALDFLQRVLTADLRVVSIGDGIPAALLNAKACVRSLMTVLRCESEMLLLAPREAVASLIERLQRYAVMDEVTIEHDPRRAIGVWGPKLETLSSLSPWSSLKPFQHRVGDLAGITVLGIHDDHLAERGVLIVADAAQGKAIVDDVVHQGGVIVDQPAYETCRIEAGVPRFGVDVSEEEQLLLETGLLSTVSFSKGCYVGQEPVCRVHSRGKVNWMLVGLEFDGVKLVESRTALESSSRTDSGYVTSCVYSPTIDRLIGLGYVYRTEAIVGTELRTCLGVKTRVVALPHVKTSVIPTLLPVYS